MKETQSLWSNQSNRAETFELSELVRELPIWETVSQEEDYLSANEAFKTPVIGMVVPWTLNYELFVTHCLFQTRREVSTSELLRTHVLPTMPRRIDDSLSSAYFQLIKEMNLAGAVKNEISLNERTIALREDRCTCLPRQLFDHEENVFLAAFANEKPKPFLIPEARGYHSLWAATNMRRRWNGCIDGYDYLICARVFEKRLKTRGQDVSVLSQDTNTVLSPISSDSMTLGSVPQNFWNSLSVYRLFPVLKTVEHVPRYQAEQMQKVARQNAYLNLREICLRKYMPICWSQRQFVNPEPNIVCLERINTMGKPTMPDVWRHLEHLAACAKTVSGDEIKTLLSDLRSTYGFLQEHRSISKGHFHMRQTALWLNVESDSRENLDPFTLTSSWISLDNLILDSPCDAPPMRAAGSFLSSYSALLREIGCKVLYHPNINLSAAQTNSEDPFNAIRSLWLDGALTDVAFQADDGPAIFAHRVVLACQSEYCRTLFKKQWDPRAAGSNADPIQERDMSGAALQVLISFCYNHDLEKVRSLQAQANDDIETLTSKCQQLLDILSAADYWLMPKLKLYVESSLIAGVRYFVRPDNVKEIQAAVDAANSKQLKAYCIEYTATNSEAVFLAYAENGEDSTE